MNQIKALQWENNLNQSRIDYLIKNNYGFDNEEYIFFKDKILSNNILIKQLSEQLQNES